MALTDQNIRLMQSEILSDVDEGGGRMTGNEVVDGVSNNLFPDVSELDRTIGRVSLRKAYPAVISDNTDFYYGVNAIIDTMPVDPNVSVTMFSTKDWDDERSDAVSRMESYLARGGKAYAQLWESHVAGQKVILLIQRTGVELPNIGQTLVLTKDFGLSTEQSQYVRITKVAATDRLFSATNCGDDFSRTIITADISDTLLFDMQGVIAHCNDDEAVTGADATVFETVVADAAKYAGMTHLQNAASLGDFTVTAATIYGQLVPSAQVESAITDTKPNGDNVFALAAGATRTATINALWDATHALYLGGGILPKSLSIVSGGITITDEAGVLRSSGTEVGTVDYANGILRATADRGAAHDVSYIPAAYPTANMQTCGFDVTIESRSGTVVFILDPIPAPGTMSISYMAQGRWYILRDDGAGRLKGSDTAVGVGTVNFVTGSVVVTLGALPDVGTTVLASWGTRSTQTVRTGGIIKAEMEISLANGGVAPGTLAITWTDGATPTPNTLTTTDDGSGNLTGDATGTILYTTGKVVFIPNLMPPQNAALDIDYQWGAPIEETFEHPIRNGQGELEITLANGNVLAKTIEVEWNLLIDKNAIYNDYTYATTQFTPAPNQNLVNWADPIKIVRDNGTGGLLGITGAVVDYTAGSVKWVPDLTVPLPLPNYVNDNLGSTTTTNANGTTVTTTFRHHLAGFRYVDCPAIYPPDESGWVKIRYRTASAGNAANESKTWTPALDITRGYAEAIVPGSLLLQFGGTLLTERLGRLDANIDPANGAGDQWGSLDYLTGQTALTQWTANQTNSMTIISMLTTLGMTPVNEVVFRTASAPLRPGSLIVQFQFAGESTLTTITAGIDGTITGTNVSGSIDYQTGIVRMRFGSEVTVTPAIEALEWYNAAAVYQVLGVNKIWSPYMVLADTVRYAAVAYSYIPLDKTILGIDPVRLPTDGRVPIFRVGDVAVVHHTASQSATIATPQTINLGRTRLSRVWIFDEGNADIRVPTTHYTTDLDAGSITLTNATGLIGPLRIEHRIEDMALVSDVQINGQLTFTRPLSHDYPATTTGVSSALVIGDLQARATRVFDQETWTNEWADDVIGNASSAEYNDTLYPLTVTNAGASQDRWALIFDSTTTVRVIGESAGQIAVLPIAAEIAPLNPATGVPYFRINPAGWGLGWSVGNVLRFNTVASNHPVWIARTVKQGNGISGGDSFRLQIRGDANG